MDLIQVFQNTRMISGAEYAKETNRSIQDLILYDDPYDEIDDVFEVTEGDMKIRWVHGGTVSTAYELAESCERVAMLDFADAKKPGGWVEEGAPTQEENMCRCTNLYEALISPEAKPYFTVNNQFGDVTHFVESYTDSMLYVPNVAIFKDDSMYERIPTRFVDVIVSPAPCGYTEDSFATMDYRIAGFLKAAYKQGATDLVLGAWGCGAFGQPPEVTGEAFASALKDYRIFKSVTFAIRETVKTRWVDPTFELFKKAFETTYYAEDEDGEE